MAKKRKVRVVAHRPVRTPIKATQGAVTAIAENRSVMADRWRPSYARALREVLNTYTKQVAHEIRVGMPYPEDLLPKLIRLMTETNRRWYLRMVQDGYELAGKELEIIRGATTEAVGTGKTSDDFEGKAEPAGVVIGGADPETMAARSDPSNDFLLRGDFPNIDKWAETTSIGSSKTKAKALAQIWQDAIASRDPKTGFAWTNHQIAQAISKRGLASDIKKAEQLARTGTIWAMAEGAQQRYKSVGIELEEWIITSDDVTCEFCTALHNVVVRVNDPFWKGDADLGVERADGTITTLKTYGNVDHPPLHPNCRCTIVPVTRMVRVRVPVPARRPRSRAATAATRR